MPLEIVDRESVIVARPTEVFAGEEKEVMQAQVDAVLDPIADAPKMVWNLEGIEDLDEDGVEMLIAANVRVHHIGGRMAIINIGEHIREMLVNGRLIYAFEWYATEDLAVAGLLT